MALCGWERARLRARLVELVEMCEAGKADLSVLTPDEYAVLAKHFGADRTRSWELLAEIRKALAERGDPGW